MVIMRQVIARTAGQLGGVGQRLSLVVCSGIWSRRMSSVSVYPGYPRHAAGGRERQEVA